jgi:hypothetical protein
MFHRQNTPMELSARLYNCAGCNVLASICSHCDRNNIYCGPTCSRAARIQSRSLASQRYQKTLRGRHKHAERQRRYRERQKNKVTHHTFPVLPSRVVLPVKPNERISEPMKDFRHCHFCKRPVSLFLRRDYLRYAKKNSLSRVHHFGRKPS